MQKVNSKSNSPHPEHSAEESGTKLLELSVKKHLLPHITTYVHTIVANCHTRTVVVITITSRN